MKKVVNLIATIALLVFISPVSQAASCNLSDVTVDLGDGESAEANDCSVHADPNNNDYINDINTDFGLSAYTWEESKNDILDGSIVEGIGISGETLTSGTWTFSGTLTDPFVIVLKATDNFASYLFNGQQDATSGTFKIIFENANYQLQDLSHISIYTTVSNVPLPAALWLFAPALLGFMGLRKKTKS